MNKFAQWHLRKNEDRKLRLGHPWIFSNQLAHSPKGLSPGAPVEVFSDRKELLARGYGNPQSLIAFRAISFSEDEKDCFAIETLLDRLLAAWKQRSENQFKYSYRVVFGEADSLPGLVLDRYETRDLQVLAYQVLTAGMEVWLSSVGTEKLFEQLVERAQQLGFSDFNWSSTVLIERKDVNIRKLEGLVVKEPQIIHSRISADRLRAMTVLTATKNEPVELLVDLIDGQKTGLFLDQSLNFALLELLIRRKTWPKRVRILDLCCYVGHWGLQLARHFAETGTEVHVDLVDTSSHALQFAAKNLERAGVSFEAHELDVMSEVLRWPQGPFDLVVADPPAFMKSRKDAATAAHAYLKLNTEALSRCRPGGLVVSCSCSGLLDEGEFENILRKAATRRGMNGRLLLKGMQGLDHPILASFPEGQYLKMFVTQVCE